MVLKYGHLVYALKAINELCSIIFIVILKHFLMLFRAPLAGIIRKFTQYGPKLASDIMVLLLPGILKTWSLLEVKSRYNIIVKAVFLRKVWGSQRFPTMKSPRCPARYKFIWKKEVFGVAQRQKLLTCGQHPGILITALDVTLFILERNWPQKFVSSRYRYHLKLGTFVYVQVVAAKNTSHKM